MITIKIDKFLLIQYINIHAYIYFLIYKKFMIIYNQIRYQDKSHNDNVMMYSNVLL